MKITKHVSLFIPVVISSVLALSACGGGGGGGPTPPPGGTPPPGDTPPPGGAPPPDNQAPEITVTGPETVFEGAPIELNVVASDPDGDTLTFSLEDADGAAVSFDSEGEAGDMIFRFIAPDVDAVTPFTFTVTASDDDSSTQATVDIEIRDISGQSVVFVERTGSGATVVSSLMRLDGYATQPETVFESDAGQFIDKVSLSPDGRWAVFDQIQSTSRLPWRIISVTGGEPVELTAGLENPSAVIDGSPQWLADSNAIIFMADGRFPGVNEVYAVTLPFTEFSEARHRISGALPDADGEGGEPPTGIVTEFVLAPVGNEIALRGDLEQDDRIEIFVTDLDGNRRRVSGPAPDADSAFGLPAWSFDASRLAFTGDMDNDGVRGIYMTSAGTVDNANELPGDLDLTGRVVGNPVWSPVANQLVFPLFDNGSNVDELLYWFSNEAGETVPPQLISGDMPAINPGIIRHFTWSPTGQHIALQGQFIETNDDLPLYVIVMQEDGSSERVRVSPPGRRASGGNEPFEQAYGWSPDGTQIVFTMSAAGGTELELYLSRMNALENPATSLSVVAAGFQCGFHEYATAPRWTPDSRLVLLNAHCNDDTRALRAHRTTSASPEELLYLSSPSDESLEFRISEDSERFVYRGFRESEPDCYLWDVTETTAGNPSCIYFNPDNPSLTFLEIVDRE